MAVIGVRGFSRSLNKHGLWLRRLAVGETTSPVLPPFYIKPSATPSGTAAEGDVHYNSTTHALTVYDGTGQRTVATLGATQTFTGAITTAGVTVATGSVLAVTDSAGLTQGGVITEPYVIIHAPLITASSTSFSLWVAPSISQTFKVAAASAVFGTASSSGTLQVEVATGTQAVGAGTNQLTGTISLAGTTNTAVNGTVKGSPDTIAAGNRVNLILGGTMTSLANCVVVVVLQRLT